MVVVGGCGGTRHGCCPDGFSAKGGENDDCVATL